MLKEQSQFAEGNPNANFTHATISAALGLDFFYRITVTNFSNTSYTLMMSDPLCDTGTFAFEPAGFSLPQPLIAGGTDVYYCQIDGIGGAGLPGDMIPSGVEPGSSGGPFPLTNTATVTATPDGSGTPLTLSDTVTANFN
jgi:hypothetical protein